MTGKKTGKRTTGHEHSRLRISVPHLKPRSSQRILIMGEPSIDHIFVAHPDSLSSLDRNTSRWKLTPETYFALRAESDEGLSDPFIVTIAAGKKWANGNSGNGAHTSSGLDRFLRFDQKDTLTKDDTGYVRFEPFDEELWRKICSDPRALTGDSYTMQLGGPARNTLETMLCRADSTLFDSHRRLPLSIDLLFLGGYDRGTELFESGLRKMNGASRLKESHGSNGTLGQKSSPFSSPHYSSSSDSFSSPFHDISHTVQSTFLRYKDWATHQAFVISLPRLGARTLIRWQEHRKHFPDEEITRWFTSHLEHLAAYDAIVINSLKHDGMMRAAADFLENSSCKRGQYRNYGGNNCRGQRVIVAPTSDMFQKDPDSTYRMLRYADVVVCNLEEAAEMTGVSLDGVNDSDLDASEPLRRVVVEKFAQHVTNGTIFISDGSRSAWFARHMSDPTYLEVYSLDPYNVNPQHVVNAGDTWAGVIMYHVLQGVSDPQEILRRATAYASLYVARHDSDSIDAQTYKAFLDEQDHRPVPHMVSPRYWKSLRSNELMDDRRRPNSHSSRYPGKIGDRHHLSSPAVPREPCFPSQFKKGSSKQSGRSHYDKR